MWRERFFQHRLPRTAFYRWPAAPPPHDARRGRIKGARGPRYPSARVPAVGPSEPSHEVSSRR